MDRGEGQQWNRAPGNLYSTPRKVALDPARGRARCEIVLDKAIPPIPDPPATKYIKHERIQSERLTKFWGRPMYLGAHVLLPEGFDEHPEARYPLVINHGHFPHDVRRVPRGAARRRTSSPTTASASSWRATTASQQEEAHQFYKDWTGARTSRAAASSRSSTPTRTTTTRTR